MDMSISISSLSFAGSLSSFSLAYSSATSSFFHAEKIKAMDVEFWYDDGAEEHVPADAQPFSCCFLEECRLCKSRLGAGHDAYMFAGEAAFCSEDCRQKWLEILETSDQRIWQMGEVRCSL